MTDRPINAETYNDSISVICEYIRQTLAKSGNLGDLREQDNFADAVDTVTLVFLAKEYNTDTRDELGNKVINQVRMLLECVFMLKPDIRDLVEELLQKADMS